MNTPPGRHRKLKRFLHLSVYCFRRTMNTKGSVTVLFLCFFALFTLTDCSKCETKILQGDKLTFKLTDGTLKDDDRFSIKVNSTMIVKRTRKQDGPGTIVKNQFLELQDVKLSDSGNYTMETFNGGIKIKSYSVYVCVYAKVPKPRVNITCQNEKVEFRCIVEDDKGLSFSWDKNGKDMKRNVLHFSTKAEADNSKYTCTAHNPVHNSTSDPVEAECSTSLTLFGFDLWFMVGILAGGGALVLLLMIVLVTLACRSCKRRARQQQDEEELRLNYHNISSNGQQKSKHTARGQPAPPEPYDNVSAQDIPCQTEPKSKNQQRARPPPPPVEDEEEQPPPLPQPRTKARPKKHEGPV